MDAQGNPIRFDPQGNPIPGGSQQLGGFNNFGGNATYGGGGFGQTQYYESDRPDFRQPDFEALAMALPPEVFKKLMMRDDLTCHSEAQVLSLVERYIRSKPQD